MGKLVPSRGQIGTRVFVVLFLVASFAFPRSLYPQSTTTGETFSTAEWEPVWTGFVEGEWTVPLPNRGQIFDTPSWRPQEKTAPPLSLEDAYKRAMEPFRQLAANSNRFRVKALLLDRYLRTDKWYYIVQFVIPGQEERFDLCLQIMEQPGVRFGANVYVMLLASGNPVEHSKGRELTRRPTLWESPGGSTNTVFLSIVDKRRLVTRVTERELRDEPDWCPENDSRLPLSIQEGVALASKELVKYDVPKVNYHLERVAFVRVGQTDKWVYAVMFAEPGRRLDVMSRRSYMSGLQIVILPSGRALPVESEPE